MVGLPLVKSPRCAARMAKVEHQVAIWDPLPAERIDYRELLASEAESIPGSWSADFVWSVYGCVGPSHSAFKSAAFFSVKRNVPGERLLDIYGVSFGALSELL
jgi:hypothetical protein